MSLVRRVSAPTAALRPPTTGGAARHASDLLLPVSVALWAFGVARTNVTHLGPYGLLSALPLVFYAGVALLVLSVATELARGQLSQVRMAMHAVALVVIVYGTAPLVYQEGRYAWLYKTIGVVQYVNSHGQLAPHIDIYQNWPGFFALAAWFDKVAGVASPLDYAKWAQLVFELAALPLLYLVYSTLALPVRQRWIALMLYSASNWIAQDYFSPQALGTLLSLGVIAIALHCMYAGNAAGRARPPADTGYAADTPSQSLAPALSRRSSLPFYVLLVLVFSVLTFTHELSPYIVVIQLGALTLFGLLRPRWLVLALAAIAVGYMLPRFAYVNSHYGLLSSFGKFFSNIATPSVGMPPVPFNQLVIQRCADALTLFVWVLALVGAWLRRRSGRTVLALLVLAYSPVLVLVAGAYGNEGLLRVYLFSLPWSAALAAAALAPLPSALVSGPRPYQEHAAVSGGKSAWAALRAPLALGVALALFFPAFFGDDRFDVITKAEVTEVTSFLETARPGPIFSAFDNAPASDTARYNLFPMALVFGSYGVLGNAPVGPDIADIVARDAEGYTGGRKPAYLMVTPSMIAYAEDYGYPARDLTVLLASLAHSRVWKVVVNRSGTIIYELPPGSAVSGPVLVGPGRRSWFA